MTVIDTRAPRVEAPARPGLRVVPSGAAGAGAKARDPWIDNARLVAAVGVVVGHFFIAVAARSEIAALAWTSTWAFRIPVYVVLAGLFTSGEPLTRERVVPLLRNVLFVYLVFDLLQTLQHRYNHEAAVWDPFTTEFGLWFLLSLFCWRIALPLLAHVRYLVLWALGGAVVAGFVPSAASWGSVSRTLALFPLFVLGWRVRDADLRARLAARWVRPAAVVLAVGIGLAVAGAHHLGHIAYSDLLMRAPYSGDLLAQGEHALIRAGLLVAGAAGALGVLALVPRRRIPFWTYLGAGSMYIYVLHLLVVQQLRAEGYFETVDSHLDLALMVAGGVALALVLASPPVRRLTRPLVQPRSLRLRPAWLRRPRRPEAVGAGRVG